MRWRYAEAQATVLARSAASTARGASRSVCSGPRRPLDRRLRAGRCHALTLVVVELIVVAVRSFHQEAHDTSTVAARS